MRFNELNVSCEHSLKSPEKIVDILPREMTSDWANERRNSILMTRRYPDLELVVLLID